jgi:RAD50-interacting protein 1
MYQARERYPKSSAEPSQLKDARQKLSTAKSFSTNRMSSMLQQTQEFERQQASVHKRLMIVTSSDTPEEATRRLRGPLEKLRKLQLAERYIDMLEYIESLKDNARGCLPHNPKEALKPYTQLKELAIQLQALQEPAVSLARQCPNSSPMTLSKQCINSRHN